MAPMETRGQKREFVNFTAEYAINAATEKGIKLNLPTKGGAGQSSFLKARLLDISVSGCGLDSAYLIPPGVILDINIDSTPFVGPNSQRKEPIKATGSVRSCVMKSAGHYRLGIQFTKISEDDKKFLDGFISGKERRKDVRWDTTNPS
jgi:c-di-GMP-binding flagellar brake protein YcgR